MVEELKPEVVSFHFGLPEAALLRRVKDAGCLVISSATTVKEARWLEERGVDAVIAQGVEAGGHRGMFLSDDLAGQVGTFALVPQVVDAVKVPVIAAGAISDARGIAAAFVLGAAGVQIGSAYLHCPESKISAPHRAALKDAADDGTALTNLMTGRPARGIVNRLMREIGPISPMAPEFPLAAGALVPLRAKAEAPGSGDFSPMWAGQAAALGRAMPARELTRALAAEAQALLRRHGGLKYARDIAGNGKALLYAVLKPRACHVRRRRDRPPHRASGADRGRRRRGRAPARRDQRHPGVRRAAVRGRCRRASSR